MKNRNKLTVIAILIVLLIILSVALASDFSYDFSDNTKVATEDVAKIMDDTLARHKKEYSQDPSTVYYSIDSYDLSKSCISEQVVHNLLTAYSTRNGISGLVTGKVEIRVLSTTRSGYWAYYYIERLPSGLLHDNGAVNPTDMKVEEGEYENSVLFSIETVERIISENFEKEPEEVRVLYSARYSLSMIYVVADGKEYIIPRYEFVEAPYGELKNDTVYEIEYFFDEMNRVLREKSSSGELLNDDINFSEEYLNEIYGDDYVASFEVDDSDYERFEKNIKILHMLVVVVGVVAIIAMVIVNVNKKRRINEEKL